MSQTILSGLSAVDSVHRARYEEGEAGLRRQLDSLEQTLRARLQELPSRSFVIYHPPSQSSPASGLWSSSS